MPSYRAGAFWAALTQPFKPTNRTPAASTASAPPTTTGTQVSGSVCPEDFPLTFQWLSRGFHIACLQLVTAAPSTSNWFPGDPDPSTADADRSYYELVRPSSMYDGGAAKCAYGCTVSPHEFLQMHESSQSKNLLSSAREFCERVLRALMGLSLTERLRVQDPTATNYEAGALVDDGSCVNYCTSDWTEINQATEYRCLKRTTGFERYVSAIWFTTIRRLIGLSVHRHRCLSGWSLTNCLAWQVNDDLDCPSYCTLGGPVSSEAIYHCLWLLRRFFLTGCL